MPQQVKFKQNRGVRKQGSNVATVSAAIREAH
jgi:hypothetical protein